ncbi:MAG: DUF456 domain-containing protein [Eubacteriales bacterium]|jgi:hypothetical protein
MHVIGLILAIILFVIGLAGTILPVLPGAPIIFLGMIVYGLLTGFSNLTWGFFIWQALFTVLTFAIDYIASMWGTRRHGGSKTALWGSAVGMIIAIPLLGPAGIILGPFLGAFLGELLVSRTPEQALRTGVGSLIGLIGGSVMKLAIEITMIIWFLAIIWR